MLDSSIYRSRIVTPLSLKYVMLVYFINSRKRPPGSLLLSQATAFKIPLHKRNKIISK